jgi:hypothetical protein
MSTIRDYASRSHLPRSKQSLADYEDAVEERVGKRLSEMTEMQRIYVLRGWEKGKRAEDAAVAILTESSPNFLSVSSRPVMPTGTTAAEVGLYDTVRPGDKVTIVNRFGQISTGKAVMRGPAGWVLNMGGRHGTPAIASPDNITAVRTPKGKR